MATSSAVRCLMVLCTIGLVFASCFSRPALMTWNEYDQIQVGTPIAQLQAEIGRPYRIHHKEPGVDEYEYVERIDTGTNLVAENHYFLIIKEGKVVGKYLNREQPPAYDLIYQSDPNYPNFP